MLAKDLKEELEKFKDDAQIFIRAKGEDGCIKYYPYKEVEEE